MIKLRNRGESALLAVVGVCLVSALGYSISTANWEFVYYAAWMVVFVAGVIWLHGRVQLPGVLLAGLALWAAAHLAGGIVPVPGYLLDDPSDRATLYNLRPAAWLPKYDQATHAYGFFVSTLCAWHAIRATYPAPPNVGAGLFIALVLIGMGLGAMNEVIEFGATLMFHETNVGGYVNTGWDLVSNLVGCLAAAALAAARHRSTFRGRNGNALI